jgi:D-glycero-D-manno-heptose 1,7-bisphosphate phosphatase
VSGSPRPTVFLDRDGTIVRLVDYLADPRQVALCHGAREGLQALRAAGFLLVVVTNQSGLARGYFTDADRRAVDRRMQQLLGGAAHLDLILHCPHHPRGRMAPLAHSCDCRKPKIGMIQQALRLFPIDLGSSYMVGDSPVDVECGQRAGLKTLHVATGYGTGPVDPHAYDFPMPCADIEVEDLGAAARWILADAGSMVSEGAP